MLGVWQSVPYIFADFLRITEESTVPVEETSRAYRGFLLAIATIPAIGLMFSFRAMQKYYAVLGASFLPALAVVLLVLNGQEKWVKGSKNGPWSIAGLAATLLFFLGVVVIKIASVFQG